MQKTAEWRTSRILWRENCYHPVGINHPVGSVETGRAQHRTPSVHDQGDYSPTVCRWIPTQHVCACTHRREYTHIHTYTLTQSLIYSFTHTDIKIRMRTQPHARDFNEISRDMHSGSQRSQTMNISGRSLTGHAQQQLLESASGRLLRWHEAPPPCWARPSPATAQPARNHKKACVCEVKNCARNVRTRALNPEDLVSLQERYHKGSRGMIMTCRARQSKCLFSPSRRIHGTLRHLPSQHLRSVAARHKTQGSSGLNISAPPSQERTKRCAGRASAQIEIETARSGNLGSKTGHVFVLSGKIAAHASTKHTGHSLFLCDYMTKPNHVP